MSNFEDRILGEKAQYYFSSSSDSEESDDENNDSSKSSSDSKVAAGGIPGRSLGNWEGCSNNTGPKGVIKDWQRFKQLEAERREEQKKEKVLLAKKLALTCKSCLDDEAEKIEQDQNLYDEKFLKQYMLKRMEEMMLSSSSQPQFGTLTKLENGDQFLDAIDEVEKNVTVIIHVCEQYSPGCEAMNGCMSCLATEFTHIKFCCIRASDVGASHKFKVEALPALLVYKGGQLLASFVRLIDEFGDDFFATDLESFLTQHGILNDKSLVSPSSTIVNN